MVTDSQQIRRTAEATHSDMLVSFIFLSSPYRGGLFVIRFSILHVLVSLFVFQIGAISK